MPGLLAIIASLLIKEKRNKIIAQTKHSLNFSIFTHYWNASSANYKKLVAGLLFFVLFNSTDVFLLLQMKANGLDDTAVIGVYIFYNLVYALLAYPIGMLADRFGLKKYSFADWCFLRWFIPVLPLNKLSQFTCCLFHCMGFMLQLQKE